MLFSTHSVVAFSLLSLASAVAIPENLVERQSNVASIDAAFKAKGKTYWGTAADQNRLSVAAGSSLTNSVFGQVTPENSMKWDTIQATRGSFNFAQADYLVNWATTNNKLIRGHTLVWYSQLPSWVSSITDKATLTTVMQTHIQTVMGRFKGKIHAWVRT